MTSYTPRISDIFNQACCAASEATECFLVLFIPIATVCTHGILKESEIFDAFYLNHLVLTADTRIFAMLSFIAREERCLSTHNCILGRLNTASHRRSRADKCKTALTPQTRANSPLFQCLKVAACSLVAAHAGSDLFACVRRARRFKDAAREHKRLLKQCMS